MYNSKYNFELSKIAVFKRSAEAIITKCATLFPVVGITGPRQSGKTILAKAFFAHLPYISLENIDIRLQAQQDPRGFLFLYKNGAIFDEIQHVPELLSYLQQIIDESNMKGRFVITGS